MARGQPRTPYRIKARDSVLNLGGRTAIMGVLNVTPDSFSDGGRYFQQKAAVERAWQIAGEGADILDIGGESTRPGAPGVSAEEELERVLPVLDALCGKYPIPISVDTSKSEVAKAALERGVSMVNDVTSLQGDAGIGVEVAKYEAAVILMHMRGNPSNMQRIVPSTDILGEIEAWAHQAVARARSFGISSDKIMLDPGIGFGKTASQNVDIIRNLDLLAAVGFPVLVGTSRKSFIGAILEKPAGELGWATGATVSASILFGAHMVRVHDVAAMREIADVVDVFAD